MENEQSSHDPGLPARALTSSLADWLNWTIVLVIGSAYFLGLTSAHIFVQDDFAA